ncbi:MAG: thioredoxin domain-containing protein, partial [Planctomycetaceae bacterium]
MNQGNDEMNRLAQSHSPYLLQHKDNPVDWQPWDDTALNAAKEQGKPIFLSVGYAACHWCHVMEHESFEDPAIAKILNSNFVCIKVDREERPDIDKVYMNAVQVMTGHGGWPMSVFLTNDLQPFYAGTYWPNPPRGGMPGFAQVLDAIIDAWNERRSDVLEHAGEITNALCELASGPAKSAGDAVPGVEAIDVACERLIRIADTRLGGFGAAPKFPHVADLDLLLRRYHSDHDPRKLRVVTCSLDAMANGGIYDHIGGGFARYSVDAHWLVSHFEKMLYDNALLAKL